MFGPHVFKEILTGPAVAVFGLLAAAGKPIGAFPAGELAHDRAAIQKVLVERRAPYSTRCPLLQIGVVVRIQQSKRFLGTFEQIRLVALKWLHPRDIHIAQIKGLFARVHPLAQRHARPARRLDPDRVEARRDPDVVHLGAKAKVIGIIGGEGFRPIEERMNARFRQHGHPFAGVSEDGLKVVEVLRQLVELEIRRNAIRGPRLCVWLERAQQDFASVLFVIGAFIGHAQDGQLGEARDGLRHDVEMLTGVERHVGAQHGANLMSPHAAAVDDVFAVDCAGLLPLLPMDARDAATVARNAGGFGPFEHLRTALPRALGKRQRDVGGVTLAVQRQVNTLGDIADVQVGVFL